MQTGRHVLAALKLEPSVAVLTEAGTCGGRVSARNPLWHFECCCQGHTNEAQQLQHACVRVCLCACVRAVSTGSSCGDVGAGQMAAAVRTLGTCMAAATPQHSTALWAASRRRPTRFRLALSCVACARCGARVLVHRCDHHALLYAASPTVPAHWPCVTARVLSIKMPAACVACSACRRDWSIAQAIVLPCLLASCVCAHRRGTQRVREPMVGRAACTLVAARVCARWLVLHASQRRAPPHCHASGAVLPRLCMHCSQCVPASDMLQVGSCFACTQEVWGETQHALHLHTGTRVAATRQQPCHVPATLRQRARAPAASVASSRACAYGAHAQQRRLWARGESPAGGCAAAGVPFTLSHLADVARRVRARSFLLSPLTSFCTAAQLHAGFSARWPCDPTPASRSARTTQAAAHRVQHVKAQQCGWAGGPDEVAPAAGWGCCCCSIPASPASAAGRVPAASRLHSTASWLPGTSRTGLPRSTAAAAAAARRALPKRAAARADAWPPAGVRRHVCSRPARAAAYRRAAGGRRLDGRERAARGRGGRPARPLRAPAGALLRKQQLLLACNTLACRAGTHS